MLHLTTVRCAAEKYNKFMQIEHIAAVEPICLQFLLTVSFVPGMCTLTFRASEMKHVSLTVKERAE